MENISDSEQTVAELNHRHEREKQMLFEDNKKLNSEVEFVSFSFVCFIFKQVLIFVSGNDDLNSDMAKKKVSL